MPFGFDLANPMEMPVSFTAMCGMFLLHGGVIDIVIINIMAHLGSSPPPLKGWEPNKDPNKNPLQRRFMAENLAYALARLAPIFFIRNMDVYLLCTLSYLLEGCTISWEINCYNAVKDDALPPATLMCIFSTWVLLTVHFNQGHFIQYVDPTIFMVMCVSVGLTWCAWIMSLIGLSKKTEGRELLSPRQ